MSCEVEATRAGFLVTRDGEPVPPRAHPPACLTFPTEALAAAFAEAIDGGDPEAAHRLIEEHGQWWR